MRLFLVLVLGMMACTPTGDECSGDETRCNNNAAEECVNGTWSVKEDCEPDAMMCMTEMDGSPVDAHCMNAMDTDTDMAM